MPGVPDIVRLIPFIVRLFPQLVKTTFYRGSLVVANKVTAATDEDLARDLNRKIKQKESDKSKDNQMVIKVSEAIKCVEDNFNNTTLIKEFLLVACKSLVAGETQEACGQKLFDKMARCIRENALRHDTPRVISSKRRYHRPSKGHGKGRGHF